MEYLGGGEFVATHKEKREKERKMCMIRMTGQAAEVYPSDGKHSILLGRMQINDIFVLPMHDDEPPTGARNR